MPGSAPVRASVPPMPLEFEKRPASMTEALGSLDDVEMLESLTLGEADELLEVRSPWR